MATNATDRVVVGSYLQQDAAQQAADKLSDRGITEIEVVQPAESVWQIEVPHAVAEAALRELVRINAYAVETHT